MAPVAMEHDEIVRDCTYDDWLALDPPNSSIDTLPAPAVRTVRMLLIEGTLAKWKDRLEPVAVTDAVAVLEPVRVAVAEADEEGEEDAVFVDELVDDRVAVGVGSDVRVVDEDAPAVSELDVDGVTEAVCDALDVGVAETLGDDDTVGVGVRDAVGVDVDVADAVGVVDGVGAMGAASTAKNPLDAGAVDSRVYPEPACVAPSKDVSYRYR